MAVVRDRIPKVFSLDPVHDVQVPCPTNWGGVGARSLNIELQKVLNPPEGIRVEHVNWTFALVGQKALAIAVKHGLHHIDVQPSVTVRKRRCVAMGDSHADHKEAIRIGRIATA